jgi:hypothetical protein
LDRFAALETCWRRQSERILDQRVVGIQLVKRLPPSIRNPIEQAFEDFPWAG